MSIFGSMAEDKAHVLVHEPESFLTQGVDANGIPVFLVSAPDDTHGCGFDTYASGATEEAAWAMAVEALS
jgi:hypothetical protein